MEAGGLYTTHTQSLLLEDGDAPGGWWLARSQSGGLRLYTTCTQSLLLEDGDVPGGCWLAKSQSRGLEAVHNTQHNKHKQISTLNTTALPDLSQLLRVLQ